MFKWSLILGVLMGSTVMNAGVYATVQTETIVQDGDWQCFSCGDNRHLEVYKGRRIARGHSCLGSLKDLATESLFKTYGETVVCPKIHIRCLHEEKNPGRYEVDKIIGGDDPIIEWDLRNGMNCARAYRTCVYQCQKNEKLKK